MADKLASSLSNLQLSKSNPRFIGGEETGYLNGIKFFAKSGARAYRNHVTIIKVSYNGTEKCLTERKSKRDSRDLPLSAHEQKINYCILTDAYNLTQHFGVKNIFLVYDNRSMLYTPVPIQNINLTMEVEQLKHASDCVRGQKIIVKIRNRDMGFLDLRDSRFFTAAAPASLGQEDRELRTFYELLAVQGSLDLKEGFTAGGEFYIDRGQQSQDLYGKGISFLRGFKKNARIVEENGKAVVKLIVDPVETAFFAQQSLAQSFHEITRGDYSNPQTAADFLAFFKHVRACLMFNKARIYIVRSLSREKLEDLRFVDGDGKSIRITEHFQKKYGFSTKAAKMPALKVLLSNGQSAYYPLDCLEVLKCQRVPMSKFKLLPSTFIDDILRRNAVNAPQRFEKTLACFSFVEKSGLIYDSFGIIYDKNQEIQLNKTCVKPQIITKTGSLIPDLKTRYNLRGHQYIDSSTCMKWMILNDSQQDIQGPIERLMNEARTRGLHLSPPSIHKFDSSNFDQENWAPLFDHLVKNGYEFVLLITQKKARDSTKIHNVLKCCELVYDIQTQQVHVESLFKAFCHENIVNKLNVKLDGINNLVNLQSSSLGRMVQDDKAFIIGLDVAHVHNSTDPEPSVVGISFNAGKHCQIFVGTYFYQDQNQEAINPQLLKESILHGLKMRKMKRSNSRVPEVVLVYRDGVSEGEIAMVKNVELAAIKKSFQEFYGPETPLPPFVMILATKRHNRRFFKKNRENVDPGTSVSNGITRLGAQEFYMSSAFPIKGTAKLTNYEIIENQTNFSPDEIQSFTHALCYAHQIINSAVSLPEPVFMAHELAKRGRNNLLCYRESVRIPPMNENGIEFCNAELTYTNKTLAGRRFNA